MALINSRIDRNKDAEAEAEVSRAEADKPQLNDIRKLRSLFPA